MQEDGQPPAGGALASLVRLESEKLERYVDHIAIDGVIAQNATLTLRQGQSLWCSRGSLLAYSEGVEWHLAIPGGATKAASRLLAGEGVALTRVRATRPGTQVTLSATQPGRLATWDLSQGAIVCTRGSFVAALGDVDIDVTVARSAGAALFGGAGLFLQRISGTGVALVHGSGDFIERRLAPGEKLLVSTGNLALFSADVGYGVKGVGGCRKMLFGREGLFMTELTGPGWVMLQSLKKTLPSQRRRS